jgi:hypothetical protein
MRLPRMGLGTGCCFCRGAGAREYTLRLTGFGVSARAVRPLCRRPRSKWGRRERCGCGRGNCGWAPLHCLGPARTPGYHVHDGLPIRNSGKKLTNSVGEFVELKLIRSETTFRRRRKILERSRKTLRPSPSEQQLTDVLARENQRGAEYIMGALQIRHVRMVAGDWGRNSRPTDHLALGARHAPEVGSCEKSTWARLLRSGSD